MSFGALLGMLTLYNAWFTRSTSQATIVTTTIFGGLYSVAGMSAFLYPESKGCDPEFGETHAQLYVFGTMLAVNILGWWLERSRLMRRGIR